MRSAARLTRLYCTLFPRMSRLGWLGGSLAVLVLLASVVTMLLSTSGAIERPVPGLLVAALVTVMLVALLPCLTGGAALRFLAAPRSHGLLPRLRATVLVSIGQLAAAVVAAAALLLVGAEILHSAAAETPIRAEPLAWMLFAAFAAVAGAIYLGFRLTRPTRWLALEIIVAFPLLLIAAPGIVAEAGLGLAMPALLAVLLAAACAGFAVWYLRAARIEPVSIDPQYGASAKGVPKQMTREAAAEILVTGWSPVRLWPAALPMAAAAGVLIAQFIGLMSDADALSAGRGHNPETTMLLVFAMLNAVNLNRYAARTRYLWLLEPGSRTALLSHAKRAAMKFYAIALVFVSALLISWQVWIAPLGAGRLAAFALVMLGVSAVTWQASLGARNLGFGGIGLGLVAAIFTMILYTGYVAGIWSLVAVSVFVAAEIVLAALLGVRNRRRWRRVDWLDYRPPRPPALQALIAGRGGTRS